MTARPVPEGQYVTLANGYRIHYRDESLGGDGRRPVVVFLHGSGNGACGYSNFKGNIPALVQAGYRVITPDLIGFGYSDKPSDVEYHLDLFVACVKQMLDAHIASDARATVAGIRQPIGLANQFGVIDTDPEDPTKIREFLEKPQNPTGLSDAPHEVLASMGNYIFDADALVEAVTHDGELPTSAHDMGGDIVPYFVNRGEAAVYDFQRNDVPGSTPRDRSYWRDVGTIESFYDAHMDLISTLPVFNLYNNDWPIYSQTFNAPPAKFVRDSVGRIGNAIDSIVSLGSVLSGTHLEHSVVGPWALAGGGSTITDSVLFDSVQVGAGARIHRAILDKNVVLEPGATIGVDRDRDVARGFTVTETGITVVGKDVHVHA